MSLIWLRAEIKPFEKRTPLVPQHAAQLIASGHKVVVEQSKKRIFHDSEYKAVDCQLKAPGTWSDAPKNAFVLGIKELPSNRQPLTQSHIYFAHAFKGQEGAKTLLNRFKDGKGKLYDLEFITDERNRRVASFSFSSGMAGATVALIIWCQQQAGKTPPYKIPLYYPNKGAMLIDMHAQFSAIKYKVPSTLIIGGYGRCGQGVKSLLAEFKIPWTGWGQKDTKAGGPFPEILNYNLLFNCVYLRNPIPPFLTAAQLKSNQGLSLITDISCDPTSANNPLPIYSSITTFNKPTHRVHTGTHPIDLIAIDHLPTFLPYESSVSFSSQLFPHLQQLLDKGNTDPVWERAYQEFLKTLPTFD